MNAKPSSQRQTTVPALRARSSDRPTKLEDPARDFPSPEKLAASGGSPSGPSAAPTFAPAPASAVRGPIPDFDALLARIRACQVCATHLPHGCHPVLQAHPDARLLVVSQAPGRKVHDTGIPFNDKSGDKLRDWMGIDKQIFYDAHRVAIVPMGFCYPGKGPSGDLPPRPECAPLWHPQLLPRLQNIQLTLAIGGYAIRGMLGKRRRATLTETCMAWQEYFDTGILPLPHPSPRNTAWFQHHAWFERDVIPALRQRVRQLLRDA